MTQPSYFRLHEEACARGERHYVDPDSGYLVFTKLGLLERDRCCGAGCRHCPFDHEAVALAQRSAKIQQAAWLTEARPAEGGPVSALFWSGGKDSFLAYRALQRESEDPIVLITTFDAGSRIIAHQDFAIDVVRDQALHLGVPLIGVPLHPGREYLDHLVPALELLPADTRLCFGDLHLEYIRAWREEAFASPEYRLHFPLWQADYDELLSELERSGATCKVSAVSADLPQVTVGDRFDRAFVRSLPDHVDRFGENGEFHTQVMFD
jgi:ATP-binding cassette subfamily B (MDR/TAP) protein 1